MYNKTYLLMAVGGRLAEVEFLLRYGTDVNAQDIFGCTVAPYAVTEAKSRPTLALLVEYRANLSIKDMFGHTVLHTADRSSDPDLRAFLEETLATRESRLGQRGSEHQAMSESGHWRTIGHDKWLTVS